MPPTPTDKEYIKSQGFPDEALDDPTFIEAISRGVKLASIARVIPKEHVQD